MVSMYYCVVDQELVLTDQCEKSSKYAANLGELPHGEDDEGTDDEELHVNGEVPGVTHTVLRVVPLISEGNNISLQICDNTTTHQ